MKCRKEKRPLDRSTNRLNDNNKRHLTRKTVWIFWLYLSGYDEVTRLLLY